jgi:hypothetical protein
VRREDTPFKHDWPARRDSNPQPPA